MKKLHRGIVTLISNNIPPLPLDISVLSLLSTAKKADHLAQYLTYSHSFTHANASTLVK